MCRARHDDPAGGSIDVTKGREILPGNVVPKHYDLTLEPNWKDFTFEGSVVIEYVQYDGPLDVHSIMTKFILSPTTSSHEILSCMSGVM